MGTITRFIILGGTLRTIPYPRLGRESVDELSLVTPSCKFSNSVYRNHVTVRLHQGRTRRIKNRLHIDSIVSAADCLVDADCSPDVRSPFGLIDDHLTLSTRIILHYTRTLILYIIIN